MRAREAHLPVLGERPHATTRPAHYLSKKMVRQVSHHRICCFSIRLEFQQEKETTSPDLTHLTTFDRGLA